MAAPHGDSLDGHPRGDRPEGDERTAGRSEQAHRSSGGVGHGPQVLDLPVGL